jgi:hypothetical protein
MTLSLLLSIEKVLYSVDVINMRKICCSSGQRNRELMPENRDAMDNKQKQG